jgi:hypothetical protein
MLAMALQYCVRFLGNSFTAAKGKSLPPPGRILNARGRPSFAVPQKISAMQIVLGMERALDGNVHV